MRPTQLRLATGLTYNRFDNIIMETNQSGSYIMDNYLDILYDLYLVSGYGPVIWKYSEKHLHESDHTSVFQKSIRIDDHIYWINLDNKPTED